MPDLGDSILYGGYTTKRGKDRWTKGRYMGGRRVNKTPTGYKTVYVSTKTGKRQVGRMPTDYLSNPSKYTVTNNVPQYGGDGRSFYNTAGRWQYPGRGKRIPGKTTMTPWNKSITQFIVDKSGNIVDNPNYINALKSLKAGSKTTSGKAGYVFRPGKTLASTYDESRMSRALQTGNYMDQTALADATYRQGANERQLRSDSLNVDYADAKRKLAEKSISDRSQIDARAAKAGIAFSQGRLNAQNSYTNSLNEDLASRNAAFTKGMFSLGAEDAASVAVRDAGKRAALNSSVDTLRQQDQAFLRTNTPVAYKPNAAYPELRKRGKDWVPYNPRTKKFMPRPSDVLRSF